MSKKAARGTKRTCQNNECGARFYDLARDPIVCPMCGSTFEVPVAPVVAEERSRRAKKPEYEVVEPAPEAPAAESEDALDAVETDAEPVAAADDETFLEEEDQGPDVSGIIGGVAEEGEEQ
jgi:uncharacterized protein (TIGR02300 family)